MARRGKNRPLQPWLSALPDNSDKRFIQIGNSLLLSKAFQALPHSTRSLYFAMAMESGGHRDFLFPQRAFRKYGLTASTVRDGIKRLEETGFIEIKMHGWNTREENRYSFSFRWKERNGRESNAV